MAAKKAPAKKTSAKDVVESQDSVYGGPRINKAGSDARGRASKFGKPVGKTTVQSYDGKKTFSMTEVKGPRGTTMFVLEEKKDVILGRDRRSTRFLPGSPNKKSQAGDLAAQRAAQRAKNKKK
jgi:hypothetical protein